MDFLAILIAAILTIGLWPFILYRLNDNSLILTRYVSLNNMIPLNESPGDILNHRSTTKVRGTASDHDGPGGIRNRSGAEQYHTFEPLGVDHLRPVTARPAYRERLLENVAKLNTNFKRSGQTWTTWPPGT